MSTGIIRIESDTVKLSLIMDGICKNCMHADLSVQNMAMRDSQGLLYSELYPACSHAQACMRAYKKGMEAKS